jgi:hypothetical protein
MTEVQDEPLGPDAARRRIREILRAGRAIYSRHAKQKLLADDLTTVDCENVLRGGGFRPGEFEHGTWRYRVETIRIAVVVALTRPIHEAPPASTIRGTATALRDRGAPQHV